MAKNKDLELRIVAKNLASKSIRDIINDLKNLVSNTSRSTGGLNTAFKGVIGGFAKIGSGLRSVGSTSLSVFSNMVSGAGRVFDALFSVKTLIMGLFAGIVAKGIGAFIGLNAEFEKLKIQMDVLTQGQGEAWFNKLNQLALDLPISMKEVSKSFISLQVYGIAPSTRLMKTLIDVASVVPESGRAIEGIARALGQIQQKRRLEGQELRQLAEWGVPAYQAIGKVQEEMAKKTGKAVADIPYTAISASVAIEAITKAIEEKFGNAAKAVTKSWSGLTIRLTNYMKEFFRQIGEGGGMQALKSQLENIVNSFEKAFKSGEMQKATDFIGTSFGIIFENLIKYFKSSKMDISNWGNVFISVLEKIIYAVTILINTLSGIKFVLLLLKFTWVGVAIILNTGLYGIVKLVDMVIQSFNWAIKLIDSIPGINIVDKETFANLADFTSGLAEAQGENLHQLGLIAYETSEDIAKTADTMTNRFGLADKMVTELRANFDKFKATEAVAPIIPSVSGEGPPQGLTGFAKEVDEIMQGLTGKQDKTFKPQEDTLKWLGEVSDLTTKAKIGFLQFEQEVDKKVLKNLKDYFKDFFGSLQSGFSNTFQGILDGSLNLKEGLAGIFKTIEQAFFQMISNMVAEWAIGKAIMLVKELLFQQAVTTATAVGEGERLSIEAAAAVKSVAIAIASGIKKIMIYAYEAAAGAFKALAGIPIIGPLLAIGAGAAALGTVIGFAKKIASFEKGTGLEGVRQNGPAMLHKGEIVLNKKESDAYRAGATDGGQPVSNNVSMNFTIQAMDGADIERIVRKKVIPIIRDNIRDFGKGRTMVKEAFN